MISMQTNSQAAESLSSNKHDEWKNTRATRENEKNIIAHLTVQWNERYCLAAARGGKGQEENERGIPQAGIQDIFKALVDLRQLMIHKIHGLGIRV